MILSFPALSGMTTLIPKVEKELPSLLVRFTAARESVPHTVTLHLIILFLFYNCLPGGCFF
jgi:hypothetical protein